MPNSADDYARSQGFKDASTMQAYYQRQHEMSGANGSDSGIRNVLNQPVQDSINQGLSWHPSVLLQYVLDKWNKATGGGQ